MYSYNAISASAGSGKTYTLALRVLSLCLQTPNEQVIKHILALTFTNKAANEMKERILSWLQKFTEPNFEENTELKGIKAHLASQGISISMEELHLRAQRVLNYILHHYSVLNISTIDKFNSKLVRSFSYELGLAQNFNLEINNEPYLIEAVDQLLDKIGEEDQISQAFMDFVHYSLENEERVIVNQTLYKRAKTFVNDVHYEELKKNETFDWEAYQQLKEQLRNEIVGHKNEARNLAKRALEQIKTQGLDTGDFYGGNRSGIGKFFVNVEDFYQNSGKKFPFPANEGKALVNYAKGTASKDSSIQIAVEGILPDLLEKRTQIIKNYIEAEKKSKILEELLPLKINKEISEQLELIEAEDDLVLLSKFNILIKENLRTEPSAFIYEKIGTRFHHYFFDEFQDTSKLQWENIIPLRDHTIYSENHSFTLVGDPKQSIYRFRGGDSEQMLSILNKKEPLGVDLHLENLEKNWRSAKNIVDFNNQLYAYMATDLDKEEHRDLFAKQGIQIAHRTELHGRVRVNLIPNERRNDLFFDEVAQRMFTDIKTCIENGFSLSDICILCRTKQEIQELSLRLGQEQINYRGEIQFLKTISEKGLTLDLSKTLQAVLCYLYWEVEQESATYLIKMLYYLNALGRIQILDFTEEAQVLLSQKTSKQILQILKEKYGLDFLSLHVLSLNFYNKIEHILKVCAMEEKEADYLLNFLEEVYAFAQNGHKSIKDFIKYWQEELSKKSIQASNNIEAIKLMTIHSAKGLEYPVVFLPMKNSHSDAKFTEWFSVDYPQLSSVNINNFSQEITQYDETLQKFSAEQVYRNKIDRFCVQYVATTRPVEQLFLYLEKPSSPEKNKLEILNFVQKFSRDEDQFDLYPEVQHSYQKQIYDTQDSKITQSESVKIFTQNTEANAIKIATPSKSYQATNEKVKQGILVHEILSKIHTTTDVEKILRNYMVEGVVSSLDCEEINRRIKAIVENVHYALYFNDLDEVLNEREILYQGAFYRPDRVVRKDEDYYIIDFKTGKEKPQYSEQIAQYKTVLEQLGKSVKKTEIIYL